MNTDRVTTDKIKQVVDCPKSLDVEVFEWLQLASKPIIKNFRARFPRSGCQEQTTAAISNALHRVLNKYESQSIKDRRHFRDLVIKTTKNLLINDYEKRTAQKRGGNVHIVSIQDGDSYDQAVNEADVALIDMIDALTVEYGEKESQLLFECRFLDKPIEGVAKELSWTVEFAKKRLDILSRLLVSESSR